MESIQIHLVGKKMKNESESKFEKELNDLEKFAETTINWMEKKEYNLLEFLIVQLILNTNLNHYESLGLIEKVKADLIKINEEE